MSEQTLHILIIDNNRLRASIIEDGLRDGGSVRVTVLEQDRAGILVSAAGSCSPGRCLPCDPDGRSKQLNRPATDWQVCALGGPRADECLTLYR